MKKAKAKALEARVAPRQRKPPRTLTWEGKELDALRARVQMLEASGWSPSKAAKARQLDTFYASIYHLSYAKMSDAEFRKRVVEAVEELPKSLAVPTVG